MTEFTLKKLPEAIRGPLLFIIMDGVGLYKGREEGYPGNALDLADAPTLKGLLASAPVQTRLQAHGKAVGLPSDEDMGNSEVGHNAFGAGRIYDQGAKLVSQAIATGKLFEGETWKKLIGNRQTPGQAMKPGAAVHFIGLLSDGNVHSHIDHLLALVERCAKDGVERLYVHPLLDGRDVEKASAHVYVERLEAKLKEVEPAGGKYAIASGGGRMKVTMDRYEADWGMVELGWKTHVKGDARQFGSTLEALAKLRAEHPDIIDQDLPAFVIAQDGKPVGPIKDGDVVIYFNFRGDRAIEISKAFTDANFKVFKRDPDVKVHYAGMMEYDGDLKLPPQYLVEPPAIDRTVSEYLAKNDVAQFAISETQKYGHVTYFWNGNNSEKFNQELETWQEIESDRISFDEAPRMKADQIADAMIAALRSYKYKFLRVNFANGDMVGHTGVLDAAVKAVEAVDQNVKRLLDEAEKIGATVIITADHGNCDQMYEVDKKTGLAKKSKEGEYAMKTSHTLCPVPFILTGRGSENFKINPAAENPGLGNTAAAVLTLLGYEAPADYLPSVIVRK